MWSFVYPGQGSQFPGMGKFLWDNFQIARETFEESSDAGKKDFRHLCFNGTDEELSLTENTQPALLVVSIATHRVIQSICPIDPVGAAGHSVGEYAAAVGAGVLTLTDAVVVVGKRGNLMQTAVPVGQGAMLAVMGVSFDQAKELCDWVLLESGFKNSKLQPANDNCPGQVVISGNKDCIEWLRTNEDLSHKAFKKTEKPKRMKLIPLKVSAPFHCDLMKPAENEMRKVLDQIDFNDSYYPIVQNFTAEAVTIGPIIRENLIQQISAPVRWVECIEKIMEMRGTHMVEVGCGKVLTAFAKKVSGDKVMTFNVNSLEELKAVEKASQKDSLNLFEEARN